MNNNKMHLRITIMVNDKIRQRYCQNNNIYSIFLILKVRISMATGPTNMVFSEV